MSSPNKIFGFIIIISLLMLSLSYTQCRAEFVLTAEGENLYKQWTEVIGFCSIDYVKANDPAPEIKAGLEITPQNAKDYPGLKKVLPEHLFKRLDPNFFLPIEKMTIVDTRPRYYSQEAIDGTKDCVKNVRFNKETLQIDNYDYGLPFPRPTDPYHFIWNHMLANNNFTETAWFDPITATTYSKARKPDSIWKANFGAWTVKGRLYTDLGPDRESKYYAGHGELERRTMLVTYPQDLKGTAFLRIRYWDVDKQDYFVSYLPGLKRIRILSGSDAQDPIIGSELTWDGWGIEYQKQPSKTLFPNEYKLLGKSIILQPSYPSRPTINVEGEQFICMWEKRPVYILEIKALDPTYTCSKRIMYIDMEHLKAICQEYYDRRGTLWRTWLDYKYLIPNGKNTWEGVSVMNWITQRHSVFKMNSVPDPPLEPSQFDMRWLIRMAR